MSIGMNTRVSGEYCFEITKPDGSKETTGWFPNLILDQGLDRLGLMDDNSAGVFSRCRLGTGSSAPAPSQTQLDSQIAVVAGSRDGQSAVNEGAPNYSSLVMWGFGFPQGSVVGNVTEVGIGWGDTGNTLFSRALILDNTGTPTTITLTSIDQLSVYYRIRFYPSLTDTTGSVVIGGTTYNFTIRLLNANMSLPYYVFETSGAGFSAIAADLIVYGPGTPLAAITDGNMVNGNQVGVNLGARTTAPYIPGSFYQDTTLSFGVGDANLGGGIQALQIHANYSMHYQVVLDQPIPKTNTTAMTLTFRYSWATHA